MKARIINDIAIDVHETPDLAFHPSIAAEFETVPDDVRAGWLRDEQGDWSAPPVLEMATPAMEEAAPRRTVVTRTEYYGLFTPQEEALIRLTASEQVTPAALKAADDAEKARLMGVASLAVMLQRTDALGPYDTIDLTNPQTQAGLGMLVTMNLLTQPRKEEIELGI